MILSQDPVATADPTMIRYWGNLFKSMLTLAEMVTYDDWGARVDEIVKFVPWMYGFTVIFLGISSLGIFNLITGVMVQAAFQIVTEDHEKGLELHLSHAKAALEDALAKNFQSTENSVKINRNAVKELIVRHREAVKDQFEKFKCEEEEARKAKDEDDPASMTLLEEESTADVEEFVVKAEMRSLYDENNVCTVVHATWCSHSDLAVGFDSVHDEADGPMREPMHSMILWDSGRSSPIMFLPDTWASARSGFISKDEESDDESYEGNPGWMRNVSHEPATPRVRNTMFRGDLIFMDVPRGTRLRFRFGGNYSTVPIFVDCPPGLDEQLPINLRELAAVDTAKVSIREVLCLLQDGVCLNRLDKAGYTKVQVLMVFQTLNVNDDGTIRANDFIDGLLRMQQADAVGFDTAGAKSFMRLLLSQCTNLASNAEQIHRTCSEVVGGLRGVSVVELEDCCNDVPAHTLTDLEAKTEMEDQAHTQRINQLTEINGRLNKLVSRRKKAMSVFGPSGFGEASSEETSTIDENRSITSARTGWD